jgi:hypothetical protein
MTTSPCEGQNNPPALPLVIVETPVSQSEQAFLAIARGNAPKEAAVKILEYKEMEPFFVKGESDEP